MQLAHSDPKGPVYLTGAREIMEEPVEPVHVDLERWRPVARAPLLEEGVTEICVALAAAKRPLVVTTYLGRSHEGVRELMRLCERLGVGVLESVPTFMNYPHTADMYQGSQWNHPAQNERLARADVVLVVDSDVPWIPTVNRPSDTARIFHIDVDPLKTKIPLWYIRAHRTFGADAATALAQINAELDKAGFSGADAEERKQHYQTMHRQRRREIAAREARPDGTITPEYLTACVRKAVGADTIILNEGITNYHAICDHAVRTLPGTFFASGGGSLGWNGGAAIGMKLIAPDKTIVALTGDGSYMFSAPSTVHWMAKRYNAPFLQVIYNNRGWRAPRVSTLAVHPKGYASCADDMDLSFDPPPDYAKIAEAAGGAWGCSVRTPEEVEEAVLEGARVVREEGRSAVIDAWLA